jgi:DNA-directed RNA polymerase subunit RPC12/RpoP
MEQKVDARCLDCGATFPRSAAESHDGDRLLCPACGHPRIRGIPAQHTALGSKANTRCRDCGATFPRGEATTPTKGVLACPVCGATSTLERIGESDES